MLRKDASRLIKISIIESKLSEKTGIFCINAVGALNAGSSY